MNIPYLMFVDERSAVCTLTKAHLQKKPTKGHHSSQLHPRDCSEVTGGGMYLHLVYLY